MNFHLEGQIVEIVIPFTDLNDNAVVPTDITAALYDGEDRLLMSFGSVAFNPAGVETRLVLSGPLNMIEGDDLQEARRLDVRITHATGTVLRSHIYAIEAEQSLQIMRNSFMTFETALLTMGQTINATTLQGASEERQRAALVEAYRRIYGIAMRYSAVETPGDSREFLLEYRLNSETWPDVTADVFQTQFPSHFKRALRAAQIAEADDLLQGNVIARKHAQGIASETIGESSVTLRAGFSGSGSSTIGATALSLLSGYIDRTVTIGRV